MVAVIGATTPAWAGFYQYSGDTTGAPTFNRPIDGGSDLSGTGTDVQYSALSFTVSQAGTYTFLSVASQPADWDTFLILYQGAFNPSDGLANFVASNDDAFAGTGASQFFTALTPGAYTLVTTGYFNDSFGTFDNQIAGPGNIAPVPEPASMAVLGLGALGVLRRRRKA